MEDDKAFIISELALDAKPYNEEEADVTWEECTLRSWLNDDFYHTAFSEEEQDLIVLTQVIDEGVPYILREGGNDTEDYIFLLSITEAQKYFAVEKSLEKVYATKYARNNGAWVDNYNDTSNWWLRSLGADWNSAVDATYYGEVNMYGGYVNITGNVVRPAMWIELDTGSYMLDHEKVDESRLLYIVEDTWIGSNVGTNIIARNYAGNYLFNSINDENGRVTSYDRQSRVLTVKTPQGNTVSEYRYDSRGKIIYYKPSGSTLWVSKDN